MQDSATSTLEAKLQDTHGGVAQQNSLRLPDSLPKGVPHTCYDDVRTRVGPPTWFRFIGVAIGGSTRGRAGGDESSACDRGRTLGSCRHPSPRSARSTLSRPFSSLLDPPPPYLAHLPNAGGA